MISAYEELTLPTLILYYNKAKIIVEALQNHNHERVEQITSELSLDTCDEKEDTFVRLCTAKNLLCRNTQQEIESVKSQTETILKESKAILTASRHVVKCYLNKKRSFDAMNGNVEALLAILYSFVKELCPSHLHHDTPGCIRHSMLQSPNDRLVLSRNVINALCGLPEKLIASINASRLSIKLLETALKQAREPIAIWRKSSLSTSPRDLFNENAVDFASVHDAENVSNILQRLIAVAKAENALTFFETSPAVDPRDSTEVENIVVHINEGLKLLAESDDVGVSQIDLCYNNLKYKTAMINKENFPNTLLLLNYFSKLFPEKVIAAIKKTAEIQLVELKLFCVDEETRVNSAKFALNRAITAQSERELVKALQDIGGMTIKDDKIHEAEKLLTDIRMMKSACKDALRAAIGKKDEKELQDALCKAEEACLPQTDLIFVAAKRELDFLRFKNFRQEAAIIELQSSSASNKIRNIRFALARAKICRVPAENSSLIAARKNLQNLLSSANSEDKNEKAFYATLNEKLYDSPPKLYQEKRLFSSRNLSRGSKQKQVKNNILIHCFREKIDESLNGVTAQHSLFASTCLSILLKCANHENKGVSLEVIKAAQNAITTVSDRQEKAKKLYEKLDFAIQENSFSELASAIASADSEPEVLDHSCTDNPEELFEMAALAKEKFAALNLHRKSEEYEKARQEISFARKNLKKAMLHESSVRPLREAVEAFRLVCSSLSPRNFTQFNKEKKISFDSEAVTFTFDVSQYKNKCDEVKIHGQKQQQRFISKTRKLYRSHSRNKSLFRWVNRSSTVERKDTNKPLTPRKHSDRQKKSINCGQPETSESKARDNSENTPNSLNQMKNFDKIFTRSSVKRRPSSAFESRASGDIPPPTISAWEEIDNKNIALLRRAEKNLKKIEKNEEKQKENAEKQEFLSNVKLELIDNLRLSIESGDRQDIFQAILFCSAC